MGKWSRECGSRSSINGVCSKFCERRCSEWGLEQVVDIETSSGDWERYWEHRCNWWGL